MLRVLSLLFFVFFGLAAPKVYSADLDLEPITLFKCWRALKKLNSSQPPTIPSSFQKTPGDTASTVPLLKKLDSSALEKAFETQKESHAKWGGLAYRGIDGSPTVLFWQMKSGSGAFETGHREAMLEILQSELKAVERYLSNPTNEKLSLFLDIKTNLRALVAELKINQKIPEGVSERFFGFLVNAEKLNLASVPRIKSIDFDSNLTGSLKNQAVFGRLEEVQAMITSISKSISSKHVPEVYRVSRSLLESYLGPHALKAPSGSRFESLD
jgi:hypothetical protein